VIVAPSDVVPVEIAHPALFSPKPGAGAIVAAALAAEAQTADSKSSQARIASETASREVAQAMMPVRAAESLKRKAESQSAAAERAVASAASAEAKEQAEDAKANVTAKVAELQQRWPSPKPSCNRSSMRPRKNAKPPSKQKRCKALRPRRRSPCAYIGIH
jgi:hypothetical protein